MGNKQVGWIRRWASHVSPGAPPAAAPTVASVGPGHSAGVAVAPNQDAATAVTPAVVAPVMASPAVASPAATSQVTGNGPSTALAVALSSIGLGVIGAPMGLAAVKRAAQGQPTNAKQGATAVVIAGVVGVIQMFVFSPISLFLVFPLAHAIGEGPARLFGDLTTFWLAVSPIVAIVVSVAVTRSRRDLRVLTGYIDPAIVLRARSAGMFYMVVAILTSLGSLLMFGPTLLALVMLI